MLCLEEVELLYKPSFWNLVKIDTPELPECDEMIKKSEIDIKKGLTI